VRQLIAELPASQQAPLPTLSCIHTSKTWLSVALLNLKVQVQNLQLQVQKNDACNDSPDISLELACRRIKELLQGQALQAKKIGGPNTSATFSASPIIRHTHHTLQHL